LFCGWHILCDTFLSNKESEKMSTEEKHIMNRAFPVNVLAKIPAMVWRSNAAGVHDYFNEYWLNFTGLSLEEALSGDCSTVIHPEDLEHYRETFQTCFPLQQPFQRECRIRRHDGVYCWVLNSGQPFYADNGQFAGYVGCCLDITEKKKADDNLYHLQKMESIGKLSAGIAHEFNNALTVISGDTELLMMKVPDDSSFHSSLKRILSASQRAAKLTRSMLAYSRKQITTPEVVNLNKIVCGLETLLRSSIGKKTHLAIELIEQRLTVFLDVSQVEQVVMNLIANARDASPPEGVVILTTGEVTAVPAHLTQEGQIQASRYAVISVADNGCGMSAKLMENMYDSYFSTKDVGSVGLGLSVVSGLVKQVNGFIACESEVGKGTTFRLYFPIYADQVESETEAAADGAHSSCRGVTPGKAAMLLPGDENFVETDADEGLSRKSKGDD
jgi:PAS domain S-box-containing protein